MGNIYMKKQDIFNRIKKKRFSSIKFAPLEIKLNNIIGAIFGGSKNIY
jgi:hypothetical protein